MLSALPLSSLPREGEEEGRRGGGRNKEREAKIPFREEENNRRGEGRRKGVRGREESDGHHCIREEVNCLDIWVCFVYICLHLLFLFCEVILFLL